MAARRGLDDIIRDAINSTRPKKKTKPYKFNVGDIANDPLSSIRPKRRNPEDEIDLKNIPYNQRPKFVQRPKKGSAAASKGGGPRRTLRDRTGGSNKVSDKAGNKGTMVKVPRAKGDYRAYAKYRRVLGSGKTGGMR